MRQYTINGKKVWLMTISELSKVSSLKVRTLREWERAGKLPRAVIVKKFKNPIAEECRRRLYLEDQARVFAAWVNKYRPGRGRPLEETWFSELHQDWDRVTQKFLEDVKRK